MSAWPGKYVIGLTGNIATGKSVVRKMLEHQGAYGIDADALSHRAIAPDAPGYQAVLETFGKWMLNPDRQIDRSRLGQIVFSDPQALERLEAIIHPLVRQAIDLLVRRAVERVIVIEAIKLLEGPLAQACDSIWVVTAPAGAQLDRLKKKRAMSSGAAQQRISAQSSQSGKISAAQVVIDNRGSFEETWRQVHAAWEKHVPANLVAAGSAAPASKGTPVVERAGPQQADEIAAFITQTSKGRRKLSRGDVMAAFGEKAFLLLRIDGRLVGLAGWQVENLVARVGDVYLAPGLVLREVVQVLIGEIERASYDLQCEVLLLYLPPHLARHHSAWSVLGFETVAPQDLDVGAWEAAAIESMPVGMVMYFKQLRKDRILRPV